MKKLMQRLASRRGESLVESMVSILIFTLASVLFLTMVTSATRINKTVKESDEAIQAARTEMEDKSGATDSEKVEITNTDGSQIGEYTVKVKHSGGLFAYYLDTGAGG